MQRRSEAHSIGNIFSCIEEYKLLQRYSQPFKQATADEIVGFIAAVLKVSFFLTFLGKELCMEGIDNNLDNLRIPQMQVYSTNAGPFRWRPRCN